MKNSNSCLQDTELWDRVGIGGNIPFIVYYFCIIFKVFSQVNECCAYLRKCKKEIRKI